MRIEQRKLIAHGNSSLTVSLPSRWLKERGLHKGDRVHIDEEGNKLILSADAPMEIERASVGLKGLDRTSILLYIQSLYRYGYNEIELNFPEATTLHYKRGEEVTVSSLVHYAVNRLIGVEIIEEEKNRILVKNVTSKSGKDFKDILRRVFFLLEETAESLLEGIRGNDKNIIKTIEDKRDNITKFVDYCLRILNKYGYPDVRKTCFYFHTIASLGKVADILKYNSRDLLHYKKTLNPETIRVWQGVNAQIKDFHAFFYEFDLERISELSKNGVLIKKKIKKNAEKIPKQDLIFLTRSEEILEILSDLMEVRLGLEY